MNSAYETLPQTPTACLLCCRLPAGKKNGKIKWQASGKKFECEERKEERKKLGMGGATWTEGRTTSVQTSARKMEFWAEKRPLHFRLSDHNNKINHIW